MASAKSSGRQNVNETKTHTADQNKAIDLRTIYGFYAYNNAYIT